MTLSSFEVMHGRRENSRMAVKNDSEQIWKEVVMVCDFVAAVTLCAFVHQTVTNISPCKFTFHQFIILLLLLPPTRFGPLTHHHGERSTRGNMYQHHCVLYIFIKHTCTHLPPCVILAVNANSSDNTHQCFIHLCSRIKFPFQMAQKGRNM